MFIMCAKTNFHMAKLRTTYPTTLLMCISNEL
uniref:Uncharacterized protein n=1 Tax=Siphoviridae sp. ctnFV5 TaxID=2823600 RepID=A0A8S5L734_9CAUD|nr:MAG TPA: hypothetical protein [Siphoviridae sp. ctnFV5]